MSVFHFRRSVFRIHAKRHNFSKGLGDWFQKHAKYALREAEQQVNDERTDGKNMPTNDGRLSNRRKLKWMVRNLPGRSWLKFFYLLIIKRGLFDGPAGWLYCRMQAHYEFMCTTILKDIRLRERIRDFADFYRNFETVDRAFMEDEDTIKRI